MIVLKVASADLQAVPVVGYSYGLVYFGLTMEVAVGKVASVTIHNNHKEAQR